MSFKFKRVLIVGFGLVGKSAYNFIKNNQDQVFVFDDNKKSLETLDKNEIFDDNYDNIDFVFKSPGVSLLNIVFQKAISNGAKILTEIELYFEFKDQNTKVIGITGTNGKSTTTAMVTHVLQKNGFRASALGNFGNPMLDNLNGLDFAVIELSSYQLEIINYFDLVRFDSSCILNLTIDHIEHHGSFENYKKAKANVLNSNNIVLNLDDDNLSDLIDYCLKTKANIKTFSTKNKNATLFINDRKFNVLGDVVDLNSNYFNEIKAIHSLQNAAACFLLAAPFLSKHAFFDAIKSFRNLEHRLENAGEFENIKFINDSKATNAESTMPALIGHQNIFWLAGGQSKKGGISKCLPYLNNVQKSYFYGDAKNEFADSLKAIGKVENADFYILKTMEDALNQAFLDAQALINQNDIDLKTRVAEVTILLSPACASWDQFKSFEHRGKVFKELSSKIIEKQTEKKRAQNGCK